MPRYWFASVTLAAVIAPDEIGNRVAPPATVVSDIGAGTRCRPRSNRTQTGFVHTSMFSSARGARSRSLDRTRSRNIVELSLRMDRYRTAAQDIEQYIQGRATPPGLTRLITELRQRIDDSLSAIDASVAAIRRFDWNALGATVENFSLAVDDIARMAGTPIPAASPGN